MKGEGVTDERIACRGGLPFRSADLPAADRSRNRTTTCAIVKQSDRETRQEDGVVLGLSSIFLDRDALFRPELAENGKPIESWPRHAPGLGTGPGGQSCAAIHQAGRRTAKGDRRRADADQGGCQTRSRTYAGRRQHPQAAHPAFLPRLLRLRPWRLHLQGHESAGEIRARATRGSPTIAPCSTQRRARIA